MITMKCSLIACHNRILVQINISKAGFQANNRQINLRRFMYS